MDATNLDAVWAAVLDAVSTQPSVSSWVSSLELVSLEGNAVLVRLRSGFAEKRGFMTPSRLGQLGEVFRPIVGHGVHLKLEAWASPGASSSSGGAANASGDPSGRRGGKIDLQSAMEMPLVRELVDEFKGDATIVGIEPDPDVAPTSDLESKTDTEES